MTDAISPMEERARRTGIVTDFDAVKTFFDPELSSSAYLAWTGWSLNLRLGHQVYLSRSAGCRDLKGHESVTILPGEFAYLVTEECLRLPSDVMAFISLRNTYKQYGLINVSGFHVDPTFHGNLIFSVFNAGPKEICVERGEALFMIFFQYVGADIPEDKHRRLGKQTRINSSLVRHIQGRSATLSNNAERLSRLEERSKILWAALALLGAVLIAVVSSILNLLKP